MQMFQKGRSMIEMLGVLAIIAVLSIGGIVLYRRAVNNHQANVILDDVNRFAFVITERGGFPANAFIDNVQYERTSVYNLDAFVGAAGGQFGIVVTDVPKGVCEPLIDKAHIDYKVRVLPANTAESVEQLSASGLIYDSFNKDICTNDLNDIVLYFGDTSAQCNKPKEGEDYTPCLSNADCCGGSFCAFQSPQNCGVKGDGFCLLVDDFGKASITIMADGVQSTWTRNTQTYNGKWLTYWSVQNWCTAQGLNPVTRADIDCDDISDGPTGPCPDSNILKSMRDKWGGYGAHWLEDKNNGCSAYLVYFTDGTVSTNGRMKPASALCH